METRNISVSQLQVVKLVQGEDVWEGLQSAVSALGITDGVILCGIGSVSSYHVHAIETTLIPPGNVFYGENGPFDVVSMAGYVIEGKVHAHITVADATKVRGGHLEKGTIAHTFCIVTLAAVQAGSLNGLDDFKGRRK